MSTPEPDTMRLNLADIREYCEEQSEHAETPELSLEEDDQHDPYNRGA